MDADDREHARRSSALHQDPLLRNFPFPDLTLAARTQLAALRERLDAHRKRCQAAHAGLTLTGMYKVLEKLRSGEVFGAKDKLIHEQGLCSLLREIQDDIDHAVAGRGRNACRNCWKPCKLWGRVRRGEAGWAAV